VNLRDYQLDAIARVRSSLSDTCRAVCLVLPTGGGKTAIASEICRLAVAKGHRVLWLAHRAELVDQAAATIAGLGVVVGAISASAQTPPNPFASVQVATIQTLLARKLRPAADVVIFDECHHAAAEDWASLLRDYPTAHVVGLTATPERGDGLGLGKSFKQIVVGTTIRDLTAAGHLVPCEILRPDRFLGPNELAQSPVDAYLEHARGRLTLVFARNVELANEYTAAFQAAGVGAHCVHGETPWGERVEIIRAFKARLIEVLVNVQVLTEGFDAPEASCAILARGCGTAGLYLQIVGRILRSAPGKRDALLLDLRGVSHELGRPDDDRVYSLDGKGIRSKDDVVYCPVCGAIREPGEGCNGCGWQPAAEPAKPDSVLGVPLVKFAAKRREGDEKRAETLARWLRAARERGAKEGAALHKYKAVYGDWPPRAVLVAARGAA
jgi:superfamily II DNA or RNA helicase